MPVTMPVRPPVRPPVRRTARVLCVPAAVLLLAACSQSDPLAEPTEPDESAAAGETIVVGSQDYYSNEIIAEIYAQALEAEGFTVERDLRIGQREVYLPEVEAGSIDLFPEYTGNLLQYWEPETEARTSDDVYEALLEAVPDGLQVLDQAPATDQDSYNVTREFAEANDVASLADLASVTVPLTLGGNSELATRPYGPDGLRSVYGVEVGFTPIEDSGGPLTVKALEDGTVQLVNIYSADPSIAANDLVTLDDPEGLFLASNVVPLAAADLDERAAEVVDAVSAALTAEDLVALNARSVDEQAPAASIAADWLAEAGLA